MHIDPRDCRIDYGNWNCCVNYILKIIQRIFYYKLFQSALFTETTYFGSAGSWLLAFSSCGQELLCGCRVWASLEWLLLLHTVQALKHEGFSSCGA